MVSKCVNHSSSCFVNCGCSQLLSTNYGGLAEGYFFVRVTIETVMYWCIFAGNRNKFNAMLESEIQIKCHEQSCWRIITKWFSINAERKGFIYIVFLYLNNFCSFTISCIHVDDHLMLENGKMEKISSSLKRKLKHKRCLCYNNCNRKDRFV